MILSLTQDKPKRAGQLFSRDDLISEVYLKCHQLGIPKEDEKAIKRQIYLANYSRNRPHHRVHSTARFTAEELLEVAHHRVLQTAPSEVNPLYLKLRQVFVDCGIDNLLADFRQTPGQPQANPGGF